LQWNNPPPAGGVSGYGNLQKKVSVIYEENEESKSKSKMLFQSLPMNPSSSNEGQLMLQNQLSVSVSAMPRSNANELGNTNKALKNIDQAAVEEEDGEESENAEQEEHKNASPTPALNLLKPEDANPNRRLKGAPVILIERFSSKKVVNHLLHGFLNSSGGL
jgi:hypothetical protein